MGEPVMVDGGDLACGELLLELRSQMHEYVGGTVVRLIATDPAAPFDVPAWCHLTGHAYLGAGRQQDDRAHYDICVSENARATRADRPWHAADK